MVHYDLGTYFSRPICTILIIAGTLTLGRPRRAFSHIQTGYARRLRLERKGRPKTSA